MIHPGDIMIKFAAPEDRVKNSRNGGYVVDSVVEVLALIKKTPNITTKQIAGTLSIGERQAQRIIKKLKDTYE